MNMYVYGAGKLGRQLIRLYKNSIQEYSFVGFIDANIFGEIEGVKVFKINEVSNDSLIIIALGRAYDIEEVYKLLCSKGFRNIYFYTERDELCKSKCGFLEAPSFVKAQWSDNTIPQVEMHISDRCNLNCKGCSHFSPLFKLDGYDFLQRIDDIKVLKKKFSHIIRFYIMGGEPLLSNELSGYCREIRKLLPETDIVLVTNGLLIPQLSKKNAEAIRNNKIRVSISEYKPTHHIIKIIKEKLNEYNIYFSIREYEEKLVFNKTICIENSEKYNNKCISDGCVNIRGGKISRCPTLMYIKQFNEYFNQKLPEEGIIDLNQDISGEDVKRLLEKKVPLCSHCIDSPMEWEQCERNPLIEDFAEI